MPVFSDIENTEKNFEEGSSRGVLVWVALLNAGFTSPLNDLPPGANDPNMNTLQLHREFVRCIRQAIHMRNNTFHHSKIMPPLKLIID
jgi:hypothetical protein